MLHTLEPKHNKFSGPKRNKRLIMWWIARLSKKGKIEEEEQQPKKKKFLKINNKRGEIK